MYIATKKKLLANSFFFFRVSYTTLFWQFNYFKCSSFFTIDLDSEIEPISLTLVQTLKPTSLYTLQKYMGIKILGIKIQMALFLK